MYRSHKFYERDMRFDSMYIFQSTVNLRAWCIIWVICFTAGTGRSSKIFVISMVHFVNNAHNDI